MCRLILFYIAFVALIFGTTLLPSNSQLLLGVQKTAGPPPPITLDPAKTAATITLDATKLIATANSSAVDGANSWSTTSHTSGKYYFEATPAVASGSIAVGFANGSELNTKFLGETNNSVGIYDNVAVSILLNNATAITYVLTRPSGGTPYGVAIDVTAKKMCFTIDGTNYFGSAVTATCNPATGANMFDLSAVSGAVFAAVETESNTQAISINFCASACTYATPSGYGNW